MPYSEKQRVVAAIAEHHPEKLYKRNRSMLRMTHKQLHDFASGPVKTSKKRRIVPLRSLLRARGEK